LNDSEYTLKVLMPIL